MVLFVWRERPSPTADAPAGNAARESATAIAAFRAGTGARWSRRVEAQRELVVLERGTLWIHVAAASNALPLLVELPDGELEDMGPPLP